MKKLVVSFLIIVIGLYFLVNVGKRVYDLYRTSDRLTSVRIKLDEARAKNEELKKEIAYREGDFFVEKEAREKLNYARTNEKIAVITGLEGPESSTEGKTETSTPNWEKWYQLFFE